jgi:hypothetical protein
MKTIIKVFSKITGLVLAFFIFFTTYCFFDPNVFLKPKHIDYALKKTSFLQSWSWTKGEINHKWLSWNQREFNGNFQNLCFVYVKPDIKINSCMEELSWNILMKWTLKEGFNFIITRPLFIDSKKTKITLINNELDIKNKNTGVDYFRYWDLLFNPAIPDLDFNFRSIDFLKNDKLTSFDLKLIKANKTLSIKAFNYEMIGNVKRITIFAPHELLIPYDLKTKTPLYLNELKLEAVIGKLKTPIKITGKIATANLLIHSEISRDLFKQKNIIKNILLKTTASLEIDTVVETINRLILPPFNILPAPLNVLEGSLKIKLVAENVEDKKDTVLVKCFTSLAMSGANQLLILDLSSDFPFELKNKLIGPVALEIDLKKVSIRLPKLSRSSFPPQLRPDSRFKGGNIIAENISSPRKKRFNSKRKINFELNLEALGEKAIQLRTNLLDEVLKLNFKMQIKNKTIQTGYVLIHPLRTTIFKRPIYIANLKIEFNAPLEPKIISTIEFHLPEYLVTLKLIGPLSKPRYSFLSNPLLPERDIVAVLLFGKPLRALGPDDKTTTKNANQIISQGILSLAVLYYLAESPIESIGYDPDTKIVSAQFGLGRKSSLYVTNKNSDNGLNSYGIRRSLGKGWYLDSSVQKKTDALKNEENDLGVLLERIISY